MMMIKVFFIWGTRSHDHLHLLAVGSRVFHKNKSEPMQDFQPTFDSLFSKRPPEIFSKIYEILQGLFNANF